MHLKGEAIQWLSRTVRDVYSAATFEELHRQIIPALHDQFGSSCSACETANGDGSQYVTQRICGNMRLPPDYAEFLWDNPNVQRLLGGRKESMLHLRQAVARADYERTDFYNVLARPNGFADQILTVVWQEQRMTIFTIHRDRLFTDGERVLLEILQEHLAAALGRVAPTTFPLSDILAAPWIALSPRWRPVALLPCQELLLRDYFPDWRKNASPLPAAVMTWLQESATRWIRLGPGGRPLVAFRASHSRGELTFRLYPDCGSRGDVLRLFEKRATLLPPGAAPLSEREQQVLHWLAEGKRDAEIAVILGIAPKTVSKHVENVLRKLRVGTRTAAAAQR